ncbi:hypothetical protein WJ966_09145 [Achromobacter xylosoxidans]
MQKLHAEFSSEVLSGSVRSGFRVDTPKPASPVAGFLGKNTVWAVFWKQADILSLRVIPNISGETFNRDGLVRQVREIAGKSAPRLGLPMARRANRWQVIYMNNH